MEETKMTDDHVAECKAEHHPINQDNITNKDLAMSDKEDIAYLESRIIKMEREKKEQHDGQTVMVITFGSLLAAGLMNRFDPLLTGMLSWPIMGAVYLVRALWK